MTTTMHAVLVDDSRYVNRAWPFANDAHVTRGGRWRHSRGARAIPGDGSYLCDAHPFLGWIDAADWSQHVHSESHRVGPHLTQATSRWRRERGWQ